MLLFGISSSRLRLTGAGDKACVHLGRNQLQDLTVGIHQGRYRSEEESEHSSALLQPEIKPRGHRGRANPEGVVENRAIPGAKPVCETGLRFFCFFSKVRGSNLVAIL